MTLSLLCQTFPHFHTSEKCGTKYEKGKYGSCGQHWTFVNEIELILIDKAMIFSLSLVELCVAQPSRSQVTGRKEPWERGCVLMSSCPLY